MKPPSRLLLVANTTWNLYNFRRPLVQALQAQGYQIALAAPPDEYLPALQASLPQCPFFPLTKLSRKGTRPWQDYALYRELCQVFNQAQADAVLLYTIKPNIYGSLAAQKLQLPYFPTITGLGYAFIKGGWLQTLVRKLYALALGPAPKVFFQNQDDLALFHKLQLLKTQEQGQYVPGSGLDLEHFQLKPLQNPTCFQALFIGRLLKDKGIQEYLQAAQQLKDPIQKGLIKLSIIGDFDPNNPASLDPQILTLAQEQGLIHYLGPQNDVRPFIEAAQVIVLPSYREGLPRVLLEGMALGRPLIATDVAGCRSLIQNQKNGLLIPPQNATALAQALMQIKDLNHEVRSSWGLFGRQWVEQSFSVQTVCQHYLQAIQNLKL